MCDKNSTEDKTEEPKDLLQSKPSHPFCRICHENAAESKLLSPCMCLGTVRNVHRKCLEHWLTSSQSSECELCGYVYTVKPKYPGVFEWLKRNPRPLIIDLVLTLFLTPLAMFSVVLCYRGAIVQVEVRNTIESLSLFALGSFLTGVYLAWMALTIRAQFKTFRSWRRNHLKLSLVYPNSPISIIVPGRSYKSCIFRPGMVRASSPQVLPFQAPDFGPLPRPFPDDLLAAEQNNSLNSNSSRTHVDSNIIRAELDQRRRETMMHDAMMPV